MERARLGERPPRHSGTGAARPTNEGRPRAGGKPRRPRHGDKTRRWASRFHGTRAPAGYQDRNDSVMAALAPAESWECGQADGTPRPGVIRPSPAAPRLSKPQSHSGASDEGVNPGPLTGLTRAGTAQPVPWAGRDAPHQTESAVAFLHKPTRLGARPPGTRGGSPTKRPGLEPYRTTRAVRTKIAAPPDRCAGQDRPLYRLHDACSPYLAA